MTISLSGWSLDTTPEFQTLADAFHEENPDVTVELKGYDAAEYNTLITADLAAGVGPDIITQKEVKFVPTFQDGGQLLDVSDVELPDGIGGAGSYEVDGTAYAVPYRQDSWVLYYNKDLFDQAGRRLPGRLVDVGRLRRRRGRADRGPRRRPAAPPRARTSTAGSRPCRASRNAQSGRRHPRAATTSTSSPSTTACSPAGPRARRSTSTPASANQLTYQGEFGKQNAAMLPMGTWFVATLIAQQASGDADDFEWGIAPIPQVDDDDRRHSTTPR